MGNPVSLVRITDEDYGKKIVLASYHRKDFSDKSIVIKLDGRGVPAEILFMSSDHGSVEWINGRGLSNCRRWENEEAARSRSYLTRRYTSILMNGERPVDFGRDVIIPLILEDMSQKEAAAYIARIIGNDSYREPFSLIPLEG